MFREIEVVFQIGSYNIHKMLIGQHWLKNVGKYTFTGLRRLCGGGCAGYVVVVAPAMWWVLDISKIQLTQPSLAGTGAELGNYISN